MANETAPRMADGSPATVAKLRDGSIALAKLYHGEPVAKTFANRAQAFRARDLAGAGWHVERRGRPFFVVWGGESPNPHAWVH